MEKEDVGHPSLSRRSFLGACGAGLAAAASASVFGTLAAQTPGRRPNIIFILADDLGWADLTPYGSRFHETPNLSKLAARSMRFTQAYAASPLCSPTRASMLTGLWPARIGITTPSCHVKEEKFEETLFPRAPAHYKVLQAQSATRLKQEYITLAETLKTQGYATGHFGKWHLGPEPYDPLHQGFDVDVPHWPGPGPAGSYLGPWKFPEALKFTGEPGEHIEDRMAKEAVKFLTAQKDKPFFLNYWCFSVHSPWQAKDEYLTEYAKKVDPKDEQKNPVYAGMVKSLDEAVGTLMKTLDDLKLTDNTLIVFFSDNGGVNWHDDKMKKTWGMDVPPTSNSPLRAGKASIYEGGTRVPCMVSWPGVVAPGTVNDSVIQSIDFAPTLMEALGIKPEPSQRFDGISILPALKGKPLTREAIYCHFPHYLSVHPGEAPAAWVRKGDLKLIRFFFDNDDRSDRHELYDLKNDLGEKNDLAARRPEAVKELGALLTGFLKESGAVVPVPNPDWRKNPPAWVAGGTAKSDVKGRTLIVVSDGKDPNIVLREKIDLPKSSYTVEMRMLSKSEGEGGLYWAAAKQNFAKERLLVFKPKHDGSWHDEAFKIPSETELSSLRIDPSSGPGEMQFAWIRLRDASGKIIKEWTFSEDGKSADSGLQDH